MKSSTFNSKGEIGNVIYSIPLKLFLFSWFLMGFFLTSLSAQKKVVATGTGNTTGHIANLSITNSESTPLHINRQIAYIPSGGQYQPYVAIVPETTISKGTTVIPINGYCADVHVPAVPNGSDMPPIVSWIPVGSFDLPLPAGTTNLLPKPTLPSFTTSDISVITQTPGYNPKPIDPEDKIITTWPGTEIPVSGTIDPKENPDVFAPVIVKVLEQIEESADVILSDDIYTTPFVNHPEKEREAVIQQTFWIFMADVTGKEYDKPVFADKVYDQYKTVTGTPVVSLPKDQKDKVDDGVDEFWNVFMAVGVEAKVLSNSEDKTTTTPKTTSSDPKQQLVPSGDPPVLVGDDKCDCGHVAFTADLLFRGLPASTYDFTTKMVKVGDKTESKIIHEGPEGTAAGNDIDIVITSLDVTCGNCKTKICTKSEPTITVSYGELETDNSSNSVKAATVTTKGTATTITGTMPEGTKDVGFFIKVVYTCSDAACGKIDCEKKFLLKVKRRGLCECDDTYWTPKVKVGKTEEEFTLTATEFAWRTKVAKDDVLKIVVDKGYINPVCKGCNGVCKPVNITYKLYGENISGLKTKAEAETVKYIPSKATELLKSKKVTGDAGDAVFSITINHSCEGGDCVSKSCEKTYTIRFPRKE